MTELEISIGGRIFSVACEAEEQEKVKRAAGLINEEADSIQAQLGRLPEAKMLLLSALMIADRLNEVESDSRVLQERSEDFSNIKNKNQELEQQKKRERSWLLIMVYLLLVYLRRLYLLLLMMRV